MNIMYKVHGLAAVEVVVVGDGPVPCTMEVLLEVQSVSCGLLSRYWFKGGSATAQWWLVMVVRLAG